MRFRCCLLLWIVLFEICFGCEYVKGSVAVTYNWSEHHFFPFLSVSALAVACCRLEAPINGQISGNDNALGSTTRFRCDSGFQLMGSEERRCQTDGTWSGTHPQCVRKLSFTHLCIVACACVE